MTGRLSSGATGAGQNASGGPQLRCMLGMLGVDCHSKGLRSLARMLRDRGVEVIYMGEHNTSAGFADAIVSEDPDVVGISFSTSTYMHHVGDMLKEMRSAGVAEVPLMIGGLIHPDHEESLREMGVAGIFGPGSTRDEIFAFLDTLAPAGARRQ
jgi:methylmalonyl-CoA mutase, C-terminal domain